MKNDLIPKSHSTYLTLNIAIKRAYITSEKFQKKEKEIIERKLLRYFRAYQLAFQQSQYQSKLYESLPSNLPSTS